MTRPLTCPNCERNLYPRTARWTPDGWACADRRGCGGAKAIMARSVALGEEIDWFRSFGWPPARIAERLGVTVSCVEKRLARAAGVAA